MAPTSIPLPRYIYVKSSEYITPHLHRVYFSSDNFSGFSVDQNGAHIKLFFPEKPELRPQLPSRNEFGKVVWPNDKKPVTRTYTIRQFLEKEQLLIVDFVRHAESGIASDWATHAQPGYVLGLAGPGGRARFNPTADYWVLIGDLSALPMIAASLEQLPSNAQGEAWIEVETKDDCIELNYPPQLKIHWLIQQSDAESVIQASLQNLNWNDMDISVTLAGENNRVVALRHFLRNKCLINKANLYAVPYWKKGQSEEGYHLERHRVMDE